MPLWVQIIAVVAALYLVTIVSELCTRREQRHKFAYESEEFLGLKKG